VNVHEEERPMSKSSSLARTWVSFAVLLLALAACGQPQPSNELPRLLGYLPPLPAYADPTEATVSFSELASLKAACGYEEDAALSTMPVSVKKPFAACIASAGLCPTLAAYQQAGLEMDIGYDVTAVRRCIEGNEVVFLEGTFDAQRVLSPLRERGYAASSYEGVATYHLDAARYTGTTVERWLVAPVGHVAVVRGGVYLAASPERLQDALDTWARRSGSLSRDASYAALVDALGPTVHAVLLPRAGRLVALGYQQEMTRKEILYAKPAAPCDGPDAPAFTWRSRDEIALVRNIVVACTAADSADANTEAQRLYAALGARPQAASWEMPDQPDVLGTTQPPIARVVVGLPAEAEGGLPEGLAELWP
jgi:hypothetical protein